LLLVYAISRRHGIVHINSLILTGIAISTLLLAAQGAILYALRDQWHLIQTLTEWEAGNTMNKTWKDVHMQLPLTLIGLWGCWSYRKEIDILSLGEEEALNLGVDVAKVRWRLFLCISLLTGGTIATVGIIGFFGLVLPHLFRSVYGSRNQLLIPLCALGGSTVLLYFDLILRFFHIHALSIGNISAVLGGIFFLILLVKRQQQISEPFQC
jgi:iron complex transport system permease protein